MKKPFYTIMSFFLLLTLSLSCGQSFVDSGEDGIRSFPLNVGNRWEYAQYDYEIPFGNPNRADTVFTSMTRRVIAIDSAGPTAGLFVIDDTLITWLTQNRPDTSISRYWWGQADNKLYEIANGSGGIHGNIQAIFWDEPRVLLDFPLTHSKSWIMGESIFGYHIRSVEALDNFQVGERNYYCAIVKATVDSLTDFETTDWFSNCGLIRSESSYGLRYLMDEIGNIIDSVYSYQDIRLIGINLVE